MELTNSQKKAVFHKDGPLLVLAGPGSGKTRVITSRVAALIEAGNMDAATVVMDLYAKMLAVHSFKLAPVNSRLLPALLAAGVTA